MSELDGLEELTKQAGLELAESVKKELKSLGDKPYGAQKLTSQERLTEHQKRYDTYGEDEWYAMFQQRGAIGMRDYFKAMQSLTDKSLEVK